MGRMPQGPRVGAWAEFDPAMPGEADVGYDALAELFLSDEAAPKATPKASLAVNSAPTQKFPSMPEASRGPMAGGPAKIERRTLGLVIGHLPVMASAWVSQLARQMAVETSAGVALVRVAGDEAMVELIGSGVRSSGPMLSSIEEAIASARERAATVLVRLDESAEPKLVGRAGLSGLVLLTGADEAAVVGTYRSLKSLVPQHGSAADLPGVRLAIAGAPAERATAAAERLERAIGSFLGKPAPLAMVLPRIGTVEGLGSELLFAGRVASVDRVLELTLEPAGRGAALGGAKSPDSGGTTLAAFHGGLQARPTQTRHDAEAAGTRPRSQPSGARPLGSLSRAAVSLPSLHVGGMRSLGRLCPAAPEVELACDEHGVLHALAMIESAGSASATAGLLAVAAGWAAENRPVLTALAEREAASLDGAAAVRLHAVCASAPAARPLLDTPIRVHLLVPEGSARAVALN